MKWSALDRAIAAWVCILATCAIIIVLAGLSEIIGKSSSNIASWVQAIGSIGAIIGASSIANSQFKKEVNEKKKHDASRDLHYAEICLGICQAVESIARAGREEWDASKKVSTINPSKFLYHVSRATSVNRLQNLQSSIISLLNKEMPSKLMVTLFSVQKNIAIYADAISAHHEDARFFEQLDYECEQNRLLTAVAGLKLDIIDYMSANEARH
ncbi:hypothetical protein [Delftia sp. RIT313]|uniref:hypothetical protein n=1 Tax=Delftia sp. RIT313 TaxID=1468410 RepID=UPI00044F04D1|nr:hypothetical protein [Delftia sp. RIT313]EZP55905.1 hypothetical protein BW39_01930 [Delftia sp. RIT313]